MRTATIYLAVIATGILVFCSYAFVASMAWDDYFTRCLGSNIVIDFFLATGWILPLLVGRDLYKNLFRREIRHTKVITREISLIDEREFESEKVA